MENAILPIGKAYEPNEGARNPMVTSTSPSPEEQTSRRQITFSEDTDLSEKASYSQSSYKGMLSQPAVELTRLQKLLWLQKRRTSGLWVQCDDCNRWRYLPNVLDNHELPNNWVCRMNPDSSYADCSVPESPICLREEEDLIHSLYSTGSVVWARMPGWPWWPAMVDDCPDTEQFYWLDGFSDIPTHYNVVFFDTTEVTRGWINPDNLKPYSTNKNVYSKHIAKKYKARLVSAMKQADEAIKLPLEERLQQCSFIAKYKGKIGSPKKITKKDLIRHQKKIRKQYNVEFPIEISETLSDEEPVSTKSPTKKRNMILLGTPKSDEAKKVKNDDAHLEAAVNVVEKASLSQIDNTPGIPTRLEKPRRRIQDSMNVPDTPVLDINRTETDDTVHAFKQPNSLVVQVGSTVDTNNTESYDNDTSKTYVPELTQISESTDNNESELRTQDFETRAVTPNSDDFDF